jgi:hypothetical protein
LSKRRKELVFTDARLRSERHVLHAERISHGQVKRRGRKTKHTKAAYEGPTDSPERDDCLPTAPRLANASRESTIVAGSGAREVMGTVETLLHEPCGEVGDTGAITLSVCPITPCCA